MANLFHGIAPLHRALDFHLERHNLLASNVAHVDTPGYKPKDVERIAPVSEFGDVLAVAMERHDPGHMQISGDRSNGDRVFEDLSAGAGADGNYVSLDREASKLAANQLRYDMVSTLVASELRGLLSAAGDMKG